MDWNQRFPFSHMEGQNWLELDLSSPKSVKSLITLQQVNQLTSFSWGQALLRTCQSGLFQNGSFSSYLARSRQGFFSDMYCENLIKFLDVKLTKVWCPPPPPCLVGSPGVFNSDLSIPNLQQFVNYSFLHQHWFPQVSALTCCGFLYPPGLSLQFGGQQIAL